MTSEYNQYNLRYRNRIYLAILSLIAGTVAHAQDIHPPQGGAAVPRASTERIQTSLTDAISKESFLTPPASARPMVWWYFMNGNISREGITRDLEGMKRVGLRGAQNFHKGGDMPAGPVNYMSAEWRELMKHAATEAARLGLELGMHNCDGWSSSGGPWVQPEESMKTLVFSEAQFDGPRKFSGKLPPPVNDAHYHDVALLAYPAPEGDARIKDLRSKASYNEWGYPSAMTPSFGGVGGAQGIPLGEIADLSSKIGADNQLDWDVPDGKWILLRIGYIPMGQRNHPASDAGIGPECDKLNRRGAQAHWKGGIQPLLADLGSLAGTAFRMILIDSSEKGPQNWTAGFENEFKSRRGYGMTPWLPALAGRIVGSEEQTERFLWDFRRTIADLYSEEYHGEFSRLCRDNRLVFYAEAYGSGGFSAREAGAYADVPMTEFWNWASLFPGEPGKGVASVAHTQGKRYVAAESYTMSEDRGWKDHPGTLKGIGDLVFAAGVNRYVIHTSVHQPWSDNAPGVTMGSCGLHFNRHQTWWPQAHAWITYLSRCQYLLQQGLNVADYLFLADETVPSHVEHEKMVPDGYDYDTCSQEVLLKRVRVEGGRLVLPDGMSYRALVLPESQSMRPEALRKIKELVGAGATVIGPPPQHSPSLAGYPACDREVQSLARELWGDFDGQQPIERTYGKGRVLGKKVENRWNHDLFVKDLGIVPDFAKTGGDLDARLEWIHRRTDSSDIYFIMNREDRFAHVECAFRVRGKRPEFWHPDTGVIEDAPLFYEQDGVTRVTIPFDPNGSVFVVFQPDAIPGNRFRSVVKEDRPALAARALEPIAFELVKAEFGCFELPEDAYDITAFVARRVAKGQRKFSANPWQFGVGPTRDDARRELRIEFLDGDEPKTLVVPEGKDLTLPEPSGDGALKIVRARYGAPHPVNPAPRTADVTTPLRADIKDGYLAVDGNWDRRFSATIAPDARMRDLKISYLLAGNPRFALMVPNHHTVLPARWFGQYPAASLKSRADGLEVIAWESGTYKLTSASGQVVEVQIPAPPATQGIAGPWNMTFPPGLGAPASIKLDRLSSWSECPQPGVKYFSGTATYTTRFELPKESLRDDTALLLDLGDVKNIAKVRLNGVDLGLLWKPPFRVEITAAAKPQVNELEIEVTNDWVNRLIGDEQYPDEMAWAGRIPDEWPDWVLSGKPRPQTRRVTWTTFKWYFKDSLLRESGLLGPVSIRSGVKRTVPLIKH